MAARFLLAVFATAIVVFFGGWLLFGVAFPEYYGSHTNEAAMIIMKKPPVMWAMAISNIAWSILITLVIQKTGAVNFIRGFSTSLWISFLVILSFDLSMFAFFDVYESDFLIIDILISSLFWAIAGGVSGAILGMRKKQST